MILYPPKTIFETPVECLMYAIWLIFNYRITLFLNLRMNDKVSDNLKTVDIER